MKIDIRVNPKMFAVSNSWLVSGTGAWPRVSDRKQMAFFIAEGCRGKELKIGVSAEGLTWGYQAEEVRVLPDTLKLARYIGAKSRLIEMTLKDADQESILRVLDILKTNCPAELEKSLAAVAGTSCQLVPGLSHQVFNKTKVAPSLFWTDLGNLRSQAKRVVRAGCDMLHLDVMDGSLPGGRITLGDQVLRDIRQNIQVPFDVHLMVRDPFQQIKLFAEAGADIISIHPEHFSKKMAENLADNSYFRRALGSIKSVGAIPSVAISPQIPLDGLENILEQVGLVLVLTAKPEQEEKGALMKDMLSKISQLKRIINKKNLQIPIEVAGGINTKNAEQVRQAGAEIIISGEPILHAENMGQSIEKIRG